MFITSPSARNHHPPPSVQQLGGAPRDGRLALEQLPATRQGLPPKKSAGETPWYFHKVPGTRGEKSSVSSVPQWFCCWFWLIKTYWTRTGNTCCGLNSQYISHVLLVASGVCRSVASLIPSDYCYLSCVGDFEVLNGSTFTDWFVCRWLFVTLNMPMSVACHVSWW